MKKGICVLMVLVLMAIVIVPSYAQQPVQDKRLVELQQEYATLIKQKLEIETKMIRLEGMFEERKAMIAEQKIEALEELKAVVEEDSEEVGEQ